MKVLNTKEHEELMKMFEKENTYKRFRKDREDKTVWKENVIYQDGEYNQLFLMYRKGYLLGKVAERDGEL